MNAQHVHTFSHGRKPHATKVHGQLRIFVCDGLEECGFGTELLLALRRRDRTLFSPHWPHGEKFVPARRTSQRRYSQNTPQYRCHAWHVLRGDSLQFKISANPAVRVKKAAEWHSAGEKSRSAGFAAPRQCTGEAEEIVQHRPAFGTPATR